MMDLEDWALENAAQLVAHVERHGIAMTWTEARDRLLHAGKCIQIPAYVDHGDGGFVPLGLAVPACQRPDFVEEVAAGVALGEGRHFFPAYPATAETPIAVPWAMATELVHRLSLLLSERLDSHGTREDIVGLVDLSLLVARLSGEVSAEMDVCPQTATASA